MNRLHRELYTDKKVEELTASRAPIATALVLMLLSPIALPQAASVRINNAEIPFSALASPEARETMSELRNSPAAPDFRADIQAARRFYAKFNDDLLAQMRSRYAVNVAAEIIGGVPTDVVTPKQGISERNRNRVLINFHGGAFLWGAGSGAVLEATPIAATSRVKVVTVDYRMAPEHKFPAASEDAAAVYRALLKTYQPQNIGLYGCSAGGILTAQAVAWFAANDLPRPGAIATLCATGAELQGDSAYLAPPLTGQPPVGEGRKPPSLASLPYFAGADPNDPLMFPIASREVLARFPPTLLIAGGRDYSASSLTLMHRRLREAGAEAELFVFDGLWHAFFIYSQLPESRETYAVMDRFFDRHLGTERKSR